MPKKSKGDLRYENEETYDNFDPKKDDLEWSKMIKEKDKDKVIKNTKHNKSKESSQITNCCTENFERIFNSHPFHGFILVLVVFECFFVAGELIVNYIETHLYKGHSEPNNKTFVLSKEFFSDLTFKNASEESIPHHDQESMTLLEVLDLIFKYGSLIILLIFVIEILIKVTLVPRNCCKFFEIFDFFIVFTAFSLNMYLLIIGVVIHGLSGLLTILR